MIKIDDEFESFVNRKIKAWDIDYYILIKIVDTYVIFGYDVGEYTSMPFAVFTDVPVYVNGYKWFEYNDIIDGSYINSLRGYIAVFDELSDEQLLIFDTLFKSFVKRCVNDKDKDKK